MNYCNRIVTQSSALHPPAGALDDDAGVLRFVEEKAPPEIRKVLDGFNFLKGDKSPVNSLVITHIFCVPGKALLRRGSDEEQMCDMRKNVGNDKGK